VLLRFFPVQLKLMKIYASRISWRQSKLFTADTILNVLSRKINKLEVEKVPLSMQNFIRVLCSTDFKLQDEISQFFEFSKFSSQFH